MDDKQQQIPQEAAQPLTDDEMSQAVGGLNEPSRTSPSLDAHLCTKCGIAFFGWQSYQEHLATHHQ